MPSHVTPKKDRFFCCLTLCQQEKQSKAKQVECHVRYRFCFHTMGRGGGGGKRGTAKKKLRTFFAFVGTQVEEAEAVVRREMAKATLCLFLLFPFSLLLPLCTRPKMSLEAKGEGTEKRQKRFSSLAPVWGKSGPSVELQRKQMMQKTKIKYFPIRIESLH